MDQYVAAAVNVRAKAFGDEEAFGARETAKALVWNLAKTQGMTPENAKKRWITVKDELTCPACGPMHYKTVELDERFTLTDGRKAWGPQLHPNCRCKAVMVITVTRQEKKGSIFDRLAARGKVEKSFNDNDWQTQPRSNDGRFGTRGRTAVMERGTAPAPTQTQARPQMGVQDPVAALTAMTSDQLAEKARVQTAEYNKLKSLMDYPEQQRARFDLALINEMYRRKIREENPDVDWLVPKTKPLKKIHQSIANKVAANRTTWPEPDVELTEKLVSQVAELPQVKANPTFADPEVKQVLEPVVHRPTVVKHHKPVVLKLNKVQDKPKTGLPTFHRPTVNVPVVTRPVMHQPTLNYTELLASHTMTEIINVVNSQVESPVVETVDIPATIKAQNPEMTETPDLVQVEGLMTVIAPDETGRPTRLGKGHTLSDNPREITEAFYNAYQKAADLIMENDIRDNVMFIRTGRNDVIELQPHEVGMVVDSYARKLAARQVESLGLDRDIDPDEPFGSKSVDIHSERVFSYLTYKEGGDLDEAQVPIQEVADHLSLEDMFADYEPAIATVEYIDPKTMTLDVRDDGYRSITLPEAMKYEWGENFHGINLITLEGMFVTMAQEVDESFIPDESDIQAFKDEFGEEYNDDEW